MRFILVLCACTALCLSLAVCAEEPAKAPRLEAKDAAEPVTLPEVLVVAKKLDVSREQIAPSLGATKYTLNSEHIDTQSQGDNASFDQTMLRFPGVVQDELDKRLHVRGEEANLQYRINDMLLPDGLLGFGQELSTKFVDKVSLIVGTLPAQYGGRTAGIVDIQTKSGASLEGGAVSCYGGSFDTINPSFEYGGTAKKLTYYFTESYLHDGAGMANPTSSYRPIHDNTDQYKGFAYLSYILDDTSRLNLILSGADSDFQLPNRAGQTAQFQYGAQTAFDSARLNENQAEQCYFDVLGYQKKINAVDFQLCQFTRFSDISFSPDQVGDLMFNGVASKVDHSLFSTGLQGDLRFELNPSHTLRGGFTFTGEEAAVNTSNWVLPADWNGSAWAQSGTTPFDIPNDYGKRAYAYGVYCQDEWKALDKLTVNYGLRFDGWNAYLNEYQVSPRVNAVIQATSQSTVHFGYARYFTPPPLELVQAGSISLFDNTTYGADPNNNASSPVKSERYHYFDAGVLQKVLPGLQAGADGYYKLKRYVLDEGQFGPAMIFSPNNADRGKVYGVELTLNYDHKGFSAYGNLACSRALAKGLISGQFQFAADELAYMQTHWYHLDHDQDITASAGASYKWHDTKFYTDALYGSGLYGGFCNKEELPSYVTVNAGVVHTFKCSSKNRLKARLDVVNVGDKVYEIRNGTGIGVFAPQYLPRRGVYAGFSLEF
ncbi:MAG: TonB-dependent receptor [Planctomycetota bacterium]